MKSRKRDEIYIEGKGDNLHNPVIEEMKEMVYDVQTTLPQETPIEKRKLFGIIFELGCRELEKNSYKWHPVPSDYLYGDEPDSDEDEPPRKTQKVRILSPGPVMK